MINTEEVRLFFDKCAPTWDAEMIRDDKIINTILDNASVCKSSKVLDVACGTGVLFDDYRLRGVTELLAVDISEKMIDIAKDKCERINATDRTNYQAACADILKIDDQTFESAYDVAMVYNAFPHFPSGLELIRKLAQFIRPGGTLSIAHGMSKEKIDEHHKGSAQHVSNGLISVEEMKKLFDPYFDVTVALSDDRMYQVCGTRR